MYNITEIIWQTF